MEDMLKFIRSQPTKHFNKGEIMIYQGDIPAVLFGIRSGFVKVSDLAYGGEEQLIWLAKKRDVIPLSLLFAERPASAYFYTAFTDVEAYMIDKKGFMSCIENNNEALLAIIKAITTKYQHIMEHLSAAQKSKARDKVLHLLSFMAKRFSSEADSGIDKVEIPLKHQDIASLIGLTRETTTLVLRRLQQEGYIAYDKSNFYIYTEKLFEIL